MENLHALSGASSTAAPSSSSGNAPLKFPPFLPIPNDLLPTLFRVSAPRAPYPMPAHQQTPSTPSCSSSCNLSRTSTTITTSTTSSSAQQPPQKICRYHQNQPPHTTNSSNSSNNSSQKVTSSQTGAASGNSSSNAAATSSQQTQQSQALRDAVSLNIVPQANVCLIGDKYLLLDPVEGSSLYKCYDISTRREYVCKIANKPCTNLITAHFRLDGHPHVNHIEKIVDVGNRCYLLFNPSQGDLHSHVRVKKRLRENEARRLFRQMCEVVKSCHEQGIVLRDLKLRKFVFVDAEKTMLKLETLEDTIVLNNADDDLLQNRRGCPAYVSPEILKANTQYSGKAADMWSLGVILYTMLVGRYPFNDSEHISLFAKISRGQYVVPDCLSAKARCIIKVLLRRDPDERLTSDDVLSHPWLQQDDLNRDFSRHAANDDDQVVPHWRHSSNVSF